MLSREEDVEAQALRTQGWSIAAIARHVGRDPKTIRSYLSGERTPGVRRKAADDPFARFEPYVAQRLTDDPHLQASTLLRELVALGFAGSYQTLTRAVRARRLRPHCEACAAAKGRATTEIEHPPGAETQLDWLELPEAPWGGAAILLVGALAHSAKVRACFSEAKDTGHLIAGVDGVIRRLGGVTKRVRIDAIEGGVIPGTRKLVPAFADACRHYGVGVDICAPRRGNRKGVVEKANDSWPRPGGEPPRSPPSSKPR
jgi:transposase